MTHTLLRKIVAEFVGTGFLVAAVVGSGIMGERLAGGNVAIALLANTISTGAALFALILTFGPISGGHFNPAVTLVDAMERGVPWTAAACYIPAQVAGSSRHNRPVILEHIRRNSPSGRTRVYGSSIYWSNLSNISIPLARS
jgi:hypothetical protein